MKATRLAGTNPSSPSPPLLQIAFLCEQWGAAAVLGDNPDFKQLARMNKILAVYRVFQKAGTPGGKNRKSGIQMLTKSERLLMANAMMASEDG